MQARGRDRGLPQAGAERRLLGRARAALDQRDRHRAARVPFRGRRDQAARLGPGRARGDRQGRQLAQGRPGRHARPAGRAVRSRRRGPRTARAHAPAPARRAPAPPDAEQPWGIRRVNAASSWETPRGQGAGAAVAVIDTGISRSHPDLAGQILGGFNALDAANPGKWDDDQGHGSHVAGTIAGKRDGKGVAGVAPLAKLYAVKVLDADGNGGYSDVIAGIEWVVKNKIPVANMSLGAEEGSEALKRAVAAATKAGLLIVAAAGNSGGSVGYPAAYPETVAIAASDIKDGVAEFSSRGSEVDFIAPGVDVKSVDFGGGWTELSGTSMAAPHAAGLAAIAWARGARTPAAIRSSLRGAASPLPGLGATLQGAGMIDASKLR
ncbi:MAG: S8 family serine peptidase [Elusimicrobiota bacterium]|nr:MAG: S8 family serine peptidase [Elusimicrobiota bacterium]